MPPSVRKPAREESPMPVASAMDEEEQVEQEQEQSGEEQQSAEEDDEGEQKNWEVEAIRKKRYNAYFIKWKGYPESENSWEPIANLKGSKELCDAFDRQLKKEKAAARGGKSTGMRGRAAPRGGRPSKRARSASEHERSMEIEENAAQVEQSAEETEEEPEQNGRMSRSTTSKAGRKVANPSGRPRGRAAVGKKEVTRVSRMNGSNGHSESPKKKRAISVVTDDNDAAFDEANGNHDVLRIAGHKAINTSKGKVNVMNELQFLVVYQGHSDQFVNYATIMQHQEAREKLVEYLGQAASLIPRR